MTTKTVTEACSTYIARHVSKHIDELRIATRKLGKNKYTAIAMPKYYNSFGDVSLCDYNGEYMGGRTPLEAAESFCRRFCLKLQGLAPNQFQAITDRTKLLCDPNGTLIAAVYWYEVIGTGTMVYEAYEPSSDYLLETPHSHLSSQSTLQLPDGTGTGWWGRIDSRRLPPELEALKPMSRERIEAVNEWSCRNYKESHALIIEAYPEAEKGNRSMGSISIYR